MEASVQPSSASAGLDQARLEVRGIGLPVLQAGPRNAREAVVFVHGNPGSGEDCRQQVQSTGPFARPIPPDMPGFGRADNPGDYAYTVEGYADFLDALLAQLGIARVQLALHDF